MRDVLSPEVRERLREMACSVAENFGEWEKLRESEIGRLHLQGDEAERFRQEYKAHMDALVVDAMRADKAFDSGEDVVLSDEAATVEGGPLLTPEEGARVSRLTSTGLPAIMEVIAILEAARSRRKTPLPQEMEFFLNQLFAAKRQLFGGGGNLFGGMFNQGAG